MAAAFASIVCYYFIGKASYTATDIMQIILEKEDGVDETEKENIYHSPQNMASGASNASAGMLIRIIA